MKKGLIFFLLLCIHMTIPQAALVYFSGFETDTIISSRTSLAEDAWFTDWANCREKGSPWAWHIVEQGDSINSHDNGAPAPRAGRFAIRFELRPGDTPIECTGTGRVRDEIRQHAGVIQWDRVCWIGVSVYIPQSWPDTTELKIMLMQLYKPGIGPTDFFFCIRNTTGTMQWHLNHGQSMGVDVQEGQWNDFVFHLTMREAGHAVVWLNGREIFNQDVDMVGFHRETPPSGGKLDLGVGLYTAYDWETSEYLIVYFDEIRIGDENSSYAEVAPRDSSTVIEHDFKPGAGTGLSSTRPALFLMKNPLKNIINVKYFLPFSSHVCRFS